MTRRLRGARRWVFAATLLTALAAPAGAAFAEPSAADKESARSLMRQGDAAFEKGSIEAAREAYSAAHAIMRVPTTGISLARTQEKLGMLVEARDTALEVTRHAPRADDPPQFAKARADAAQLAEALTARIPSLRVRWTPRVPVAEVQLVIDGAAVPPGAASSPRKLNPGKRAVELSAPGYRTTRTEVTLAEGKDVTIDLTMVAGQGATATPQPAPGEPDEPSGPSGLRIAAIAAFGVGAVGLGVGAVTGILSLNQTADLKEECTNNACPAGTEDRLAGATTLATTSNVAFVVAGVGLATGVVLLIVDGARREQPIAAGGRQSRATGDGSALAGLLSTPRPLRLRF